MPSHWRGKPVTHDLEGPEMERQRNLNFAKGTGWLGDNLDPPTKRYGSVRGQGENQIPRALPIVCLVFHQSLRN
jgi:hypothetical protein